MLAYLRLLRLPNVFTALADIGMGFVLARQGFSPPGLLAALALSSAGLYLAGMVLNDAFDIEVDRRERPQRPLPSGKIAVAQAWALGFTLLALGVVFGWLAGVLYADDVGISWRSGVIASALAGAVLLYDAWLKKTWLGPAGMGLCRFLNVLLGLSAGAAWDAGVWAEPACWQLLVALGIGVYVTGITIYAKGEAEQSSQLPLIAGVAVMVLGISLLAVSAYHLTGLANKTWALIVLVLPGATIVRRCFAGILDPSPAKVQAGVKHAILSLIVLDAALCLAVAPPIYAIAVIALLAPALLLGRWIYST